MKNQVTTTTLGSSKIEKYRTVLWMTFSLLFLASQLGIPVLADTTSLTESNRLKDTATYPHEVREVMPRRTSDTELDEIPSWVNAQEIEEPPSPGIDEFALLFFTQPRNRPDIPDGGILSKLEYFCSLARSSLDVAMYQLESMDIAKLLVKTSQRGVRIRVITDNEYTSNNPALSLIRSQGIPVIDETFDGGRNEDEECHNKFLIADNTYIWTGSLNFTDRALQNHEENVIIFKSPAIARAYSEEFTTMWGSVTSIPDPTRSQIGVSKTTSPRSSFSFMGYPLRLHFSPGPQRGENITDLIIAEIAKAKHEIYLVQFMFTERSIADALITAYNRGVKIRGVCDFRNADDWNSAFRFVRNVTGGIRQERSAGGGIIHHKLMLIDPVGNDCDPVLIIGSYNFTRKANNANDENILFIHQPDLVKEAFNLCVERFGE